MSAILQRFNIIANDALVKISEHLWPEAKIALVIYTPGKPEEEIVLKDMDLQDDEVVSTLRRRGLSIDGDNVYKRDLSDSIIGTLKFGYDDRCPPPEGHWAQTFWDIGREHGAAQQELASLRAEVKTLRADKARLDSGMIMTFDRDEFGETHQTERHGMNLRAAIDEAIGRSHPLNPA